MKPISTVPPNGGGGWYTLYSVLLTLGMPLILLILLAKKRSRPGMLERLGVSSRNVFSSHAGDPVVWIHAVSMGEAMAIVPLVVRIKEAYPESRVVVSTITETGRDVVLDKLQGLAEHLYFPLDHGAIVNRVLDRIRPHVFMFVDTELWPNVLRTLQRRRIPTMLINGRLSSRSFAGYMRIRPFMKHVTRSISFCAMQSQRDVDRMRALGVDAERVAATGSIKCDQTVLLSDPQMEQSLDAFVNDGVAGEVLIAASTHPGEEEALLIVYKRLLEEFPSLVLVFAPRHLHRVADVESVIRSHDFIPLRRTSLSEDAERPAAAGTQKYVRILDTHGELASTFQFASIVWVGGSWVPVGGHNLMEPAQWGKPIFFGPFMDHVSEMAEMMVGGGGGIQVSTLDDMTQRMAELLREPEQRHKVGRAAQQVVKDNQGALDRTLSTIYSVLGDPALTVSQTG